MNDWHSANIRSVLIRPGTLPTRTISYIRVIRGFLFFEESTNNCPKRLTAACVDQRTVSARSGASERGPAFRPKFGARHVRKAIIEI